MREIYKMIRAVASSPSTVLICGESGTGKRMVAEALHQTDRFRKDKIFIEVSCGALPETLLESELFGHIRGSFTGAIKDRAGRFEVANRGTIFLDEIDTCSPGLQVKLLRVLEQGTYERVGDTTTLKSNVRIIAATNQNLEQLVRIKSFREDLYWRLNVICINLPPLRERVEDVLLLVEYFLARYNPMRIKMKNSSAIEKVSKEALDAMLEYLWPGNVRELANCIERACILVKGNVIKLSDLPDSIFSKKYQSKSTADSIDSSLKCSLRASEGDIVLNALKRFNWNCTKTAVHLGINRTTLYNKMKKCGIKKERRRYMAV